MNISLISQIYMYKLLEIPLIRFSRNEQFNLFIYYMYIIQCCTKNGLFILVKYTIPVSRCHVNKFICNCSSYNRSYIFCVY